MKLTLNVENRKPLVNLVSRFAGEAAVYMRMPTCAYRIGGYTVTRDGNLETPDDLDSATIHALYEVLASGGYHPKEAEPVAESAENEEEAEPNIGAEENARADGTAGQAKTASAASVGALETSGLPADVLRQLNALRTSLVREINRQINGIIRCGGVDTPRRNTSTIRENPGQAASSGETASITLYGDISTLRGTKPTLVKYGDDTIPVSSWKRAFAAVLDICNRQEHYHEALLAARNETMGRSRKVIADSPQGMLSPLKIDDDLYIETNFSTEALLKLLRDRILNRIGFDSRSIVFEYWRP
ncbi:MAG: hypothetical protein NC305_10950 [Lachnospiraceae bacterium]|nr:hypothetical protein [Muribaculaceae bacterium]MCM1411050.1 hypothetical protein [Lachnospiraceae bacterium]